MHGVKQRLELNEQGTVLELSINARIAAIGMIIAKVI